MNTRFLRGNPLGEPWGVAVSHDGTIYVSDWDKSCIHTYNENGRYMTNFGSSGTNTHLKYPAGIAIDKRGRIIVADRGNHVVCIYTPEGNLLNRFGKPGRAPGELYFPFGVSVNKEGTNIFVSESGNHRISVFDSQGKFLRCFGKKGSEPGMFNLPRHMCIDQRERLIVSDEQNQRVQIFTSY
jgi:DNA-binding beta-propeller fold protein YncE